jgi:carbamoyl-phosphate synthase small subunit
MRGVLLLEDGRRFEGRGFGARGTRVGEAVFNTAMTGYQEVLTDPSYREQIVVMTTSHVGNTGVNLDDPESAALQVSGFVARRFTDAPSNWRSTGTLAAALEAGGIPAVDGLDTRALVRHLRDRGAMRCAISTDDSTDAALRDAIASWPGMEGRALANEVACDRSYVYSEGVPGALRVSVVDGGIKRNILRLLAAEGVRVTVHPITATADVWLQDADAVFVGNGPGDPAALGSVITELKKVVGVVPTLGICLGCQLLGLSLGATTYKLKFGHRGGNHPVRDELKRTIAITSQNHGFAVDRASLEAVGGRVSHVNLNDHTVSGFVHDARRVMAVQYHPEACPGPHDSVPLFREFLDFATGGAR